MPLAVFVAAGAGVRGNFETPDCEVGQFMKTPPDRREKGKRMRSRFMISVLQGNVKRLCGGGGELSRECKAHRIVT
jgi:hypothetical protein